MKINESNKRKVKIKSGKEVLTFENIKTGFRLLDFWRWSDSDLLSNSLRGKFAEFIVATALDIDKSCVREEWDAYDLITDDRVKIEVKSAAYVQTGEQSKYSSIRFSIKPKSAWEKKDESNNKGASKRQADIYVMCLLKHKDQSTIDPMKLEQWEFYVVTTKSLDKMSLNQKSIGIKALKKLTPSVSCTNIQDAIRKALKE